MKRIITLAATMILLIGVAAAPAMAADATAAIDFSSAYVWRGQTFNNGAVMQPSIDAAAENGLGINVWGNYDIDDYDGTIEDGQYSEIDLTISYGKTFGKVDVGVGLISYLFPAGGSETHELYLSLGMPIIGGLSAGLDVYYDIDAIEAFTYAALSIAYSHDFTEQLNLEASASMGYAGEDFAVAAGGDDGGLYDYNLSLALGYAITDAWSVSASATYVDALDTDNLKKVEDGGLLDTTSYFMVGVAYAF